MTEADIFHGTKVERTGIRCLVQGRVLLLRRIKNGDLKMFWAKTDFNATTTPNGVIEKNIRISAPISGKLKKIKVKTSSGCQGRTHPTSLLIKRVGDNSDMVKIDLNISDCTEAEHDISPPFSVRGGQDYDIALTSNGFGSGELVKGNIGVYYSLG